MLSKLGGIVTAVDLKQNVSTWTYLQKALKLSLSFFRKITGFVTFKEVHEIIYRLLNIRKT